MRRMREERYMIHDEVLYELYNLNLDTVIYKIIDGQPYLINTIKRDNFEIGFRKKLDEKLDSRVESGTLIKNIDSILNEDLYIEYDYCKIAKIKYDKDEFSDLERYSEEIYDKYGKYLCLSNNEKYIMNILLDKYLDSPYDFSISLKEMEIMYRSMAISRRNIVLNNDTYNRYLITINLLCNKELYIKTNAVFRNLHYGVNNIEMVQSLIKINNSFQDGSNNVRFSYSFGMLGKILKNSKRYSTLVPAEFFKVNFNQVKENLVAMYLARIIFIEKGLRTKTLNPKVSFEIDLEELTRFVEDPIMKIKSNYNRHSKHILKIAFRVLKEMEEENKISYYNYSEINPEDCKDKSQEEKDREQYLKELDEYWNEKSDEIKPEIIKSLKVYLGEVPNDEL